MEIELATWSRRLAVALLLALPASAGADLPLLLPLVGGIFFFIFLSQFRGRFTRNGAFGVANLVTLLRLLGSFAFWFVNDAITCATLGFFLLLTDGLDGFLARRLDSASEFGAHFDMETDAFFVLALSWSLYLGPIPEIWMLIPGFLRYIFVAYRGLGDVRESRFAWGRTIHVVVVLALLFCLLSPDPPLYFVGAGATALLVASFGYEHYLGARRDSADH